MVVPALSSSEQRDSPAAPCRQLVPIPVQSDCPRPDFTKTSASSLTILNPVERHQCAGGGREQMERHHYLGCRVPFGANLRYWVRNRDREWLVCCGHRRRGKCRA